MGIVHEGDMVANYYHTALQGYHCNGGNLIKFYYHSDINQFSTTGHGAVFNHTQA